MQLTACGFVGLGDQGAPIAARMIAAGYPLTLWARRSESLEPFRGSRAVFANDLAALGAAVDHVGICVAEDQNVREVCNGLIKAMRPGSTIAVHSTTHPGTPRELAVAAANEGIRLVDAPVSGGRPAAQAGELTVMIGGDQATADRLRPIFKTFASLIIHLGDIGSGQIAKLINNSLLAANLGAAHMAVCAGSKLGLDRDALLELLTASSGRSFALDSYRRQSDLASFRRRLRLFEQLGVLASVLGDEGEEIESLRASARQFFDDNDLAASATITGNSLVGQDVSPVASSAVS